MKKLKIITFIIGAIAVSLVILAFSLKARDSVKETPAPTPSEATAEPVPVPTEKIREKKTCYYYLDEDLFEVNAQSGTVVTCTYESSGTEKKMQVYLPYGYDESKKYNVLVLMHGSDGYDGYWFEQYQFYDERSIELKNVLDNMIYWGYCDPLIVVSPTYYMNDEERKEGDVPDRDYVRTPAEIRQDIIPYIKANFSTYDEREHFAFIGASYGSMILYNGVLPLDFDLFSWWGAISGYDADIFAINSALNSYGDDMKIDYFYTSAGSRDSMKRDAILGFNNMLYYCDKITGENICYTEIVDAYHNGRVWVNGIYNCLLIFFK